MKECVKSEYACLVQCTFQCQSKLTPQGHALVTHQIHSIFFFEAYFYLIISYLKKHPQKMELKTSDKKKFINFFISSKTQSYTIRVLVHDFKYIYNAC